jgi:23S rRNA (guanosine2251-2'-O)-methyltransferase
MHNGYVAEIEHLDQPDLKEYIKEKKELYFCVL